MNQQFEFRLVEEESDAAALHRRRAIHAGALPAVIDVEPVSGSARPRSRAVKAQPSLLPRDVVAADAFRITLLQCKWHITANVPVVVDARDAEGLHQLRVSLRRLRVALSSFGGEFRAPELEAVRLRAKSIGSRLAPARDLDVFTQDLLEPAASANGAKDAFAVLRARAETARREAWNDTVAQIGGAGFRIFLRDIDEAIDRRLWSRTAMSGGHATTDIAAFDAPALALADRMLAYRQRSARKRARCLDVLSVAQRHKLRIALKKLRYAAEFFAPFYEKSRVEKFLSRLGAMQDVLGALNDVAVAHNTLEKLVAEPVEGSFAAQAELNFAAGIVYGWHLERASRTWEDAVKRWKKFSRTTEFWSTSAA
jgi:CHAD domain-containing protein